MGPAAVRADGFVLSRTLKLAVWTLEILFVLLFHCDEQAGQGLDKFPKPRGAPGRRGADSRPGNAGWLCAPAEPMR